MKVLIAFLLCIVAASGNRKTIADILKEPIDVCKQEMSRDPAYRDSNNLTQHPCFRACVDKEVGVMNKDGSYNLQRILSLVDTDHEKKQAIKFYNNKMLKCMRDYKDHCKISECIYKQPESKDTIEQ